MKKKLIYSILILLICLTQLNGLIAQPPSKLWELTMRYNCANGNFQVYGRVTENRPSPSFILASTITVVLPLKTPQYTLSDLTSLSTDFPRSNTNFSSPQAWARTVGKLGSNGFYITIDNTNGGIFEVAQNIIANKEYLLFQFKIPGGQVNGVRLWQVGDDVNINGGDFATTMVDQDNVEQYKSNYSSAVVLPTATISYGANEFCPNGTVNPTVSNVTLGPITSGSYSSSPAGLSINPTTGAINLGTSQRSNYTVTYTFTNGFSCTNTATTDIKVGDIAPTILTEPPSSVVVCQGAPAQTLTVQASGIGLLSYQWFRNTTNSNTGGTLIPGAISSTYIPPIASIGTAYYYVVITDACGASRSRAATVTVTALATSSIAYPASPYCKSLGFANVTQTGNTGGVFSSTPGLVIDPATGAVNLNASSTGTYTVNYVYTSIGCNANSSSSITINPSPPATIAYAANSFCTSQGIANVTITGTLGGIFSNTAGMMVSTTTGQINLASSLPGNHTVSYTVTNGLCTTVATFNLVINAAVINSTISYPTGNLCNSGVAAVTITGTTSGSFSSTPGLNIDPLTGFIDLGSSLVGSYTITYAYGSGTCAKTTTSNITIISGPTASIIYSGGPFCPTGVVDVIRNGQAGGVFSSTSGLSINSSTGQINSASSVPGSYTVSYNYTNGTCSGTATTSVIIDPRSPNPTPNNVAYCQNGTGAVPLTATGTNLLWYNTAVGGTGASIAPTPLTAIAGTTSYWVTQNSNLCESNRVPLVVTINTNPTLPPITGILDIVELDTTRLRNLTPGGIWTSNTPAVATINNTGLVTGITVGSSVINYNVTSGAGCTSSINATVTVKERKEILKDLIIPNVVTVNSDVKNDNFVIKGLDKYPGAELMIFNRWGVLIYQSKDYKNDWSGKDLNEATYYCVLTVRYKGIKETYKGWIQVLK